MPDQPPTTGAERMTFEAFEQRVLAEPDMELGWYYWNWLLPDTAPHYFVLFVLMPLLHARNRHAL